MFLRDLSAYSLQGLRIFAYVATLGSVAEAAGSLGLSQPAVSLQIKNLEDHLGFELFQKKGRRNVLSEKGQQLLQNLLPQLEHLEQVLTEARKGERAPKLSLGAVEGIGEHWVWKQLSGFKYGPTGRYKVVLEIDEATQLENLLLEGRLDLVITPRKFEHPRVSSHVLLDEKLIPVGTKEEIQKLKEAFSTAEKNTRFWENFSWIGYGDSRNVDPWAPRWFEAAGVEIEGRFRYTHMINSYSVVKDLLLDGWGLCVAPAHVCAEEIAAKKLYSLEGPKYPPLKNRLYMSYRTDSLDGLHMAVKTHLLKCASQGA